jgi:RNA polymerase sigma factor (sigma-70 family)
VSAGRGVSHDLIRRAQAGDRAALEELFTLYQERVLRRVRRRMFPELRRRMESMDVLQSGMREALQEIGRFEDRGPDSFYRWLCRVVEYKMHRKMAHALALKRDPHREMTLERNDVARAGVDASGEDGIAAVAPGPDPAQRAAGEEEVRVLREEIERLEEEHRWVVQQYLEGRSDAEIGALLGGSSDAARRLRIAAIRSLARRVKRRVGPDASR